MEIHMKKSTILGLVLMSSTAFASNYCNVFIPQKSIGRFSDKSTNSAEAILEKALQRKGYHIVVDRPNAAVEVSAAEGCEVGSSSAFSEGTSCDKAIAKVVMYDISTSEKAEFYGSDEGIFFSASSTSALKKATLNIPKCN